jgi:hypothetical protein
MDTGQMEFVGELRMESDFEIGITPSNYMISTSNQISFYSNKIFDFSAFDFLPVSEYEFFATQLSFFNVYTNLQSDPYTGLYTTAISQDPKMIQSQVTLLSFDQTLALIGGYAGTIWMIIEWLIGGFQGFAYNNSLLRKLYTTDRRRRGRNLIEDDDTKELEARLANRTDAIFSYLDFLKTKYTVMCCCCFKWTRCYR